jgi:serine/threonine protein kinase
LTFLPSNQHLILSTPHFSNHPLKHTPNRASPTAKAFAFKTSPNGILPPSFFANLFPNNQLPAISPHKSQSQINPNPQFSLTIPRHQKMPETLPTVYVRSLMASSPPALPEVGADVLGYFLEGIVQASRVGHNTVFWSHEGDTKIALKFLFVEPQTHANIYREIVVQRAFRHPHLLGYRGDFEFGPWHVLVTDFAPGGSVASYLRRQRHRATTLPEFGAKQVLYQIMDGLAHMHMLGYVHGDIKPQNFLLFNQDMGDPDVRLADFGTTRKNDGILITDCYPGTAQFKAPEILRRDPAGWGEKADIWSFGITMHFLLTGAFPWRTDGRRPMTRRPSLNPAYWADLSEEAYGLVNRMLAFEPNARPSAEDVLRDPWFSDLRKGYEQFTKVERPLAEADSGAFGEVPEAAT